MRTWRYYYKNQEGEAKSIVISEATRRKADAKFVAITRCFEAEKIESINSGANLPPRNPQLRGHSLGDWWKTRRWFTFAPSKRAENYMIKELKKENWWTRTVLLLLVPAAALVLFAGNFGEWLQQWADRKELIIKRWANRARNERM
ncbi:MAG: hypothetical protein WBV94_09795 [Blastocatellia bacterium]